MKAGRFLLILLTMGVVGFYFSSCKKEENGHSDDKGTPIIRGLPKMLIYKGYKIKEFKMYVGSPQGGKEVNTDDINIENYWGKFIDSINREYEELRINFLLRSKITDSKTGEVCSYRFGQEGLQVYSYSNKFWTNSEAYGSVNQLCFKQNFSKYKITINAGGIYAVIGDTCGKGFQTLESMLPNAQLSSLSDMKNAEDTLMWCNMDFVLE